METALTLLYTHNLRGNLELLPRLFSFIQRLRADLTMRTLLIDLGQSCDPAVWPCNITGGRATLFVLDAMGYHAVNVDGLLTIEHRDRMRQQLMLALVDEGHPYTNEGIRFVSSLKDDDPTDSLCIYMQPTTTTYREDRILHLAPVDSGQVGIVRLEGERLRHQVRVMPAATPVNPTITGAVDFVVAEAQQLARRKR